MRRIRILILIFFLSLNSNIFALDANDKSVIRGSIVFRTYCALCHGENADGKGRLAEGKIPPPANLTKTFLSDAQKEEIIRKGGMGVNRSPFMPPWKDELSNEQIKDVISYINFISKSK
ncbi:c-type cytochrome [Leptospira adleri]|uniref:Cytochrome C n=1 Tax=Leptospira adleri TaxID=2023186 RepID=A0A2M9YIR8_9LEPT|nr:cytochrome c [Leptospira adleri]PJZ51433.1 cytochrome C [Leptospira adleri]PJZ61674.1 cytochrome C [Leptospira adleri]TGM60115.1 cytochrome c [Leptospira adleri]